MDEERILADTRHWIEAVVIGLDLCPFAKQSIDSGRLRVQISAATNPAELLESFADELRILQARADELDSSLLVHPNVLRDFSDFNGFLEVADAALVSESLEGEIQVASFHPDYRFRGAGPDDIANATNRSPHPMLHLLREESIARATRAHSDPKGIPARNVERLRVLGWDGLVRLRGRPPA